MKTEIQLIQNKAKQTYTVMVNGKDAYTPFVYTDDIDNETDIRRMAKAAAFDVICNAQMEGKIYVSYIAI